MSQSVWCLTRREFIALGATRAAVSAARPHLLDANRLWPIRWNVKTIVPRHGWHVG